MNSPNAYRLAAVMIGFNLALCATLLHILDTQAGPPVGGDFVIYWAATQLAWHGHVLGIYDLPTLAAMQDTVKSGMNRHAGWFYPPMFLLIILPLGLLAYLPAWIGFSVAGLLLYCWSLSRWLPAGMGPVWLLAFPGLWLNLIAGQNGLITVSLMALAADWLSRRPARAGIPVGLLIFKPHLGILLPFWLLHHRAWRTLAAATVTALVFCGLCTLVFGPGIWAGFLAGLRHGGEYLTGSIPLYRLASVFGLLRRAGLTTETALLLHGMVALAGLMLTLFIWRRSRQLDVTLPALVAGTFLCSPYLYDYDTTWLLLPMSCLFRLAQSRGWRPGEKAWLLAAWLSPLYPQVLPPILDLRPFQLAPLLHLSLLLMLLRDTQSQPDTDTHLART